MSAPVLLPALVLLSAPQQEVAPPAAPFAIESNQGEAPAALPVLPTPAVPPVSPAPAETAISGQTPPDAPAQPSGPVAQAPGPIEGTLPAEAEPGRIRHHAKGDPFERLNRHVFNFSMKLDHAVYRPIAMAYKHVVPSPVRSGLRNVLRNLGEPLVFLNYLLQLKPGRAAKTLGRVVINTTVGIGGLIDVAKSPKVNLPHHDNGFADTLGFYGVKPGPYLFLPLLGPTTLRDLFGGNVDGAVMPVGIGKPFDRADYQITKTVLDGLDERAEADTDFHALLDDAVDPYATLRSVYLQFREAEIQDLKTRPKAASPSELEEPLEDPGTASAPGKGARPSTAPELGDPLTDPAAEPAPPVAASSPSGAELDDPLADPAATGQSAEPAPKAPEATPR